MTTVPSLVRQLQDSLLGEEWGIPEPSYNVLRDLVGATLGGDAVQDMEAKVEAVNGWFYYAEEQPEVGEESVVSMNALLAALDRMGEDHPEEDLDLEEVDLYDDLAD